jgi:hypothetical protein
MLVSYILGMLATLKDVKTQLGKGRETGAPYNSS